MTVALIALCGVLISVLGSMLSTSRQLRLERSRAQLEYRHMYLGKLFDRRIDTYPQLYAAISTLAKSLRTDWSQRDIETALERLTEWDSANAVFVSPSTAKLLIELRHELWDRRSGKGGPEDLLVKIGQVENALRAEIGVFDTTGFHNPGSDPSRQAQATSD